MEIKLVNAKEYLKILFEEPFDLNEGSIEGDFYNIIKDAQRNAVEYTLSMVENNLEADWEPMGWLADQHCQMEFKEGEDYEVTIPSGRIREIKEFILKLIEF